MATSRSRENMSSRSTGWDGEPTTQLLRCAGFGDPSASADASSTECIPLQTADPLPADAAWQSTARETLAEKPVGFPSPVTLEALRRRAWSTGVTTWIVVPRDPVRILIRQAAARHVVAHWPSLRTAPLSTGSGNLLGYPERRTDFSPKRGFERLGLSTTLLILPIRPVQNH